MGCKLPSVHVNVFGIWPYLTKIFMRFFDRMNEIYILSRSMTKGDIAMFVHCIGKMIVYQPRTVFDSTS